MDRRLLLPKPGRRMKDQHYDPNIHRLPWFAGWLLIALVAFAGTASYLSFFHLPTALTEADLTAHPLAFNGARAWESLRRLEALGPKPTGSDANELHAVQLLEREFSLANATRHAGQELLYDHQIVSGAYVLRSQTSVYRRVQNLVVKLVGEDDDRHALLLNCHFDTVASSPGASDDGGSCAVLLELIRVLSRDPRRPRHSIVFLFNGAEETPLQASHGFITGHRWAANVRAFVNLESAGSGGKELLFQSGPEHPWLLEAYARAVRRPFGQAIGEEIFQLGLIPSDTDFRIFRDHGHIPGLDLAHIANGYRYHTRYDSIAFLSPDVLQRTGDNVLALVRLLANGNELAEASGRRAIGRTVFFDVLGLFFVSYSATEGSVLNVIVSIAGLAVGCWNVLAVVGWCHWRTVLLEVLHGASAMLVGSGAALGFNLAVASLLDCVADRSMAWFGSSPWLPVGLYCGPAMMLLFIVHREFHRLFRRAKTVLSLTLTVQARITGVYLCWSLLTLAATISGIRSIYVISMLLTLCLLATTLVTLLKLQAFPTGYWLLLLYLPIHTVGLLWTTQFYHLFTQIFIPIAGRSGANDNPDLIIATVATGCTVLVTSFLVPLINLLRKPYRTVGMLLVLFAIASLLAVFTPVGFPYRAAGTGPHQSPPKVQRILVQHTLRQFYGNGATTSKPVPVRSDAGYLFRLWDRHNERTIREVVGTASSSSSSSSTPLKSKNLAECEKELFCGLPGSAIRFPSLWAPQPDTNRPDVSEMVVLSLDSRVDTPRSTESDRFVESKLTFRLTGSFQATLLVRPRENVTLAGCNLTPTIPPPLEVDGGHWAYAILLTHGLSGNDSVPLVLDLRRTTAKEGTQDSNGAAPPIVEISVATTFWEYQDHFTDSFAAFVHSFPDWAHVVPAVTVVNVYSF